MLAEFLLSFRYDSDIEGCPFLVGKRDVKNVIQLCVHKTCCCIGQKIIATLLLADNYS